MITAEKLNDDQIVTYHNSEETFFQKDPDNIFRSRCSAMYITICDEGMENL